MKITADVHGGECNAFVGDCGNYEDRPDIMLAGNFHAGMDVLRSTNAILGDHRILLRYGRRTMTAMDW